MVRWKKKKQVGRGSPRTPGPYSRSPAAIPTMLDNLALADAVTMPNPDWAADLTELRPDINVYLLPDLEREDQAGVDTFAIRFAEIAAAGCDRRIAAIRERGGGDGESSRPSAD